MYPPYTEDQKAEIQRNFAKFVVGFVLIKLAIHLSIHAMAKALRD